MLEVFYSTRMRRMELANLQLFDVDFDRRSIFVGQGKGRKDRMVPIGERALAWSTDILIDVRPRWAPVPGDNWLILTDDGTPFSPSRLTQMTRYGTKAPVPTRNWLSSVSSHHGE